MFPWAGRAKEVPLCSLAADGGPNPAPRCLSINLGVIQVHFGAGAAVARRSEPARPLEPTPNLAKASAKLRCSAHGLEPWAGLKASKLLFAVLREKAISDTIPTPGSPGPFVWG